MSYVDLMSNDRWYEHDHVNRTEAMVRAHWSAHDEAILNAKLWGAALGIEPLTQQEQMDIADLKAARTSARLAGLEARADAALLHSTLDAEPSYLRLRQPVLEPVVDDEEVVLNQEELDKDLAERAAAQAVVDACTQPVLDLLLLRNPILLIEESIEVSEDEQ
jgi:hypothetical protein